MENGFLKSYFQFGLLLNGVMESYNIFISHFSSFKWDIKLFTSQSFCEAFQMTSEVKEYLRLNQNRKVYCKIVSIQINVENTLML